MLSFLTVRAFALNSKSCHIYPYLLNELSWNVRANWDVWLSCYWQLTFTFKTSANNDYDCNEKAVQSHITDFSLCESKDEVDLIYTVSKHDSFTARGEWTTVSILPHVKINNCHRNGFTFHKGVNFIEQCEFNLILRGKHLYDGNSSIAF